MEHLDLIVFGLLVAVAGLALLANAVKVPYPIFLVIGGLALGLVPGVPKVELSSQLVLLIFLPPLLYVSAFFSSPRDLLANIRSIGLLSVGLVVLTTIIVAGMAHWMAGLSWPVAFVLGAVVSPTDPTAATAIAERLGVPRRIVTILEGESLINDGTGLVLYQMALAVVVGSTFSFLGLGFFPSLGLNFVVGVVVGVAIGLLVGLVIVAVRRRVEDPLVETTITLLTGYAAYLPAEELNSSYIPASGVLAAVTAGLYLGWHAPHLTSPNNRLQSFAFWDVLAFILNSLLFILVGLQLPNILGGISESYSLATLASYAAAVCLAVIAARFLWVFSATYIPRKVSRRFRERDPSPPWQNVLIVAYSGMRGAVSLAAALAIPVTTVGGNPFPGRDLVIFLAYGVIFGTLVGQGLTLQPLIRWLDLQDDGAPEREEVKARLQAAEAALQRIEELADEEWVYGDTAERLRGIYGFRCRRFAALHDGSTGQNEAGEEEDLEMRSAAFQRFRRELLGAEREVVLRLRSEGKIGDQAMRRIERDLDLEDSRLEI